MADNITVAPAAEGVQYALDDVDGVFHQRVKVEFGADGEAADVSAANPLPVSVQGVSTEATLIALKASIDALNAKITACNTGSVTINPASAVVVSGSVTTPTEDALIYLLTAILEKMPRVDASDRMLTNGSEVAAAVSVSSGTVTTVGTVGNQTNIGGRDAAHATFALANMGALHIYDNIRVTA